MATHDRPLAGHGIVVTRPAGQGEGLVRRLAELGADPIVFPTIVIEPAHDPAPLQQALAHLADFHFAVFVSANAVEHALDHLSQWPAGVRAVAPGPATAAALSARGVPEAILPHTTYDSEGLLALPEMGEVRGRRFVIFRGDGGREHLGDTLSARGAEVRYVTAYRRGKPTTGTAPLVEAWESGALHAITVTSSEGLDNLRDMLDAGGRERLSATPVFAPHARIVQHARELGVREAVATPPGDDGLCASLVHYFESR
jgi:uroporphyrinogen-III synthase